MDLSDGLAKDLPLLCGPALAALLDMDALPPSAETLCECEQDREAMLRHIMCDGEDYELLFAVDEAMAEELESMWTDRFGAPPSA